MISKKDYYFKLYLAEVDKEYDEYLDRFYKAKPIRITYNKK